MNEIEREFNTDVKQKKSIARGAYARKNGSKSKKCSLPSDNLTPAQKRKLNGPVLSYAINQPMSWDAFKEMPTDLQQAHLDYIQNRFNIGKQTISEKVFGQSRTCLHSYASYHGLHIEGKQGYVKYDDLWALDLWLKGNNPTPETEPEPTEVSELSEETVITNEVVATETEEETTKFPGLEALPELFCGGKLCLSGKASEVIPSLLTLIGSNEAWLSVHLSFTRKDD